MSKDTKKKCLACGATNLLAVVTIVKTVPFADKNGTVKIGGQKLGQMDLKNYWDKFSGEEDAPEQKIRGPVMCGDCEAEHFYVVGSKKPLRLGSTEEARRKGHAALLSED